MARLLVSVRSSEEAKQALAGGASIIDVKEPLNGALGRASFDTWRDVAQVVPAGLPVSVALGEFPDWIGDSRPTIPPEALEGVRYCKVGLAGVGPNWVEEWTGLADSLTAARVQWIAVVYTDWEAAGAPSPTSILSAGFRHRGVLLDTWDKAKPAVWTPELFDLAEGLRLENQLVAVAGGLTEANLEAIAVIRPDIVAVRGAVCEEGDRLRDLDQRRVEKLVEVVRKLPEHRRRQPTSNRTP